MQHRRKPATVRDAEKELQRLFPSTGEDSRLTLRCRPADFSASRIARAVEDCDAHLINLNVTATSAMVSAGSDGYGFGDYADDAAPAEMLTVELRVNHRDPWSVARSLERYGYEVDVPDGDPLTADSVAHDRYDELMHILNL